MVRIIFKVTGNALNIEYYFWWRDDCFGLLIYHDVPFDFMVSFTDSILFTVPTVATHYTTSRRHCYYALQNGDYGVSREFLKDHALKRQVAYTTEN